MEKKPTAAEAAAAPGAAAPPRASVCERLFNAMQIHPTFNNFRRLTYRQTGASAQEQGSLPVPTAPPMATIPQPGSPTTTPSRRNAPVLVPERSTLGTDDKLQGSLPPATEKDKTVPEGGKAPPARMGTSSVVKAVSEATPAADQATAEAPNGAGGKPQGGKPKRNINDKVEAYINRTRNKMRAPSHLGRTTTTASK